MTSSWWKNVQMTDHPGERPPQWQTTPMADHPDDRPPRWKTTPMADHRWETILMTYHPDDRPPWWETTLMKATLTKKKNSLLEPQFFWNLSHTSMHRWKTTLMEKKNFSIRTTFYPKIFPIISPCKYLTKDRPSFKATVLGFLGWSQTDGFHCTSKYPQTSMCRVKSQRWKMSSILSHALSPNITPHTLTKFQRRCTVNCKLTKDTIICNKLHWKKIIFFSLSFFQRKIGERDYV